MAVTAQQRAEVSQLYVAMFGRAPDGEGLGFWTQKMGAGETMAQISDQMYATAPARSFYPNFLSNQEIIGRFYTNVLGRTADTEGLNFWTAKLNAAGATPGSVITQMIGIVAGYTGTDAAGLESQKLFNNKAAVALHYGEANLGINDATTILSTVTSDAATVTAANAVIDATAAGSAGAFTLTNGTDVATASVFTAGLVYTPGGDDRINALQDEDQLTGTTGTTDRLDATLGNANDNGGVVITPKLAGIEVINVGFSGSNSAGGNGAVIGLDLQDATGVTEINITRVSQAQDRAEIGNIMTPASTLSLSNTNANMAGTVEISYAAGVLKTVDDKGVATKTVGNLKLSNVQIGTLNIGENTSGINNLGVSVNGFEDLNLVSTGAANTVGTFNLPADTGTTGIIKITGDKALTLAATNNVTNAVSGMVEALEYTGGILQAQGRLQTIDASELTAAFNLSISNRLLSEGKADTSGVDQDVTIKGSVNNDNFYLNDTVGKGDTIDGGTGDDTLVVLQGGVTAGLVKSVESVAVKANNAAVTIDFDKIADAKLVSVQNISNNGANQSADFNSTVTLNNLTTVMAADLSVMHGVTNNNSIDDLTVVAALKTDTAADLLQVTIKEGINTDERFNFTLDANKVESITLVDTDTESNSVMLSKFATQTGTIKLTGGVAGKFINLDVNTTAGTDSVTWTKVVDGVGTAATGNQQGLLGITVQDLQDAGSATLLDAVAGHTYDVSNTAGTIRLGAAVIDAAAEASNVYVRVGTNAASVFGAQTITTGSGNDVVIFDNLNDDRAGLTISDKVDAGTGSDTLAIDGHGVRISLAASEWTNVKGFETLQLVGTSAGAINNLHGNNAYNITLTNDFIDNNGGDMIAVLNDNDASNDSSVALSASGITNNTAGTGVESAVTIDARSLNAQNHFSYNGEEGAGAAADRFILADANINGGNVIDGGAADHYADTFGANVDVLEVRDNAQVTAGDLQGVKNIAIIAGTNGSAVAQVLNLELIDSVVDALVDSYHAASATEKEVLTVRVGDFAADSSNATVAELLNLDARTLTNKFIVNVTLDNVTGQDNITLGTGTTGVAVTGFETTIDNVILSKSIFTQLSGASVAGGDIAAADLNSVVGPVNATTDVSAQAIVFDQTNGNIYYNTDAAVAGGLVLIGSVGAAVDLVAADFSIIA